MEKRLIVILEKAQLEIVKIGKKFELLNPSDHASILKKNERDEDSCRPDLTHLCLLTLLDSPLNRSDLLQVYVHTTNNLLIEIHPETRIPRTFKRFAGLMVQLIHKLSIKDKNGRVLIKVIKNPITDHLPSGAKKIAVSSISKKINSLEDLVPKTEDPIVIAVPATEDGELDLKYADEHLSLSRYPLTPYLVSGRLCCTFEDAWGIL